PDRKPVDLSFTVIERAPGPQPSEQPAVHEAESVDEVFETSAQDAASRSDDTARVEPTPLTPEIVASSASGPEPLAADPGDDPEASRKIVPVAGSMGSNGPPEGDGDLKCDEPSSPESANETEARAEIVWTIGRERNGCQNIYLHLSRATADSGRQVLYSIEE